MDKINVTDLFKYNANYLRCFHSFLALEILIVYITFTQHCYVYLYIYKFALLKQATPNFKSSISVSVILYN